MCAIDFRTKVNAQTSVAGAVGLLVEDFRTKDKALTAIQVGACNGKIENDHLHEAIKGQNHVQAHLIEAVQWLFDELVEVMSPYAKHVHCHHAVIGARDEHRIFYSVSPQIFSDLPDTPEWIRFQIGSLTDEHLKKHVPEKYIVEHPVRALSPITFMKQASVDPNCLNLLMTDTEGFDGEIVSSFIKVSRPEMIVYEHNVMPLEDNQLLREHLHDLHYETKVIGADLLAWRLR